MVGLKERSGQALLCSGLNDLDEILPPRSHTLPRHRRRVCTARLARVPAHPFHTRAGPAWRLARGTPPNEDSPAPRALPRAHPRAAS